MSSVVALGARTDVVCVATEKKGSEVQAPLVSSAVSSASYSGSGKLSSYEDKVEGTMEVQVAGSENREMEW